MEQEQVKSESPVLVPRVPLVSPSAVSKLERGDRRKSTKEKQKDIGGVEVEIHDSDLPVPPPAKRRKTTIPASADVDRSEAVPEPRPTSDSIKIKQHLPDQYEHEKQNGRRAESARGAKATVKDKVKGRAKDFEDPPLLTAEELDREEILRERKERRRSKALIVKDRTTIDAPSKKAVAAIRKEQVESARRVEASTSQSRSKPTSNSQTKTERDTSQRKKEQEKKRKHQLYLSSSSSRSSELSSLRSVLELDDDEDLETHLANKQKGISAGKKRKSKTRKGGVEATVKAVREGTTSAGPSRGIMKRAANIGDVPRVTLKSKSGIYNNGASSAPTRVNSKDSSGKNRRPDPAFAESSFLNQRPPQEAGTSLDTSACRKDAKRRAKARASENASNPDHVHANKGDAGEDAKRDISDSSSSTSSKPLVIHIAYSPPSKRKTNREERQQQVREEEALQPATRRQPLEPDLGIVPERRTTRAISTAAVAKAAGLAEKDDGNYFPNKANKDPSKLSGVAVSQRRESAFFARDKNSNVVDIDNENANDDRHQPNNDKASRYKEQEPRDPSLTSNHHLTSRQNQPRDPYQSSAARLDNTLPMDLSSDTGISNNSLVRRRKLRQGRQTSYISPPPLSPRRPSLEKSAGEVRNRDRSPSPLAVPISLPVVPGHRHSQISATNRYSQRPSPTRSGELAMFDDAEAESLDHGPTAKVGKAAMVRTKIQSLGDKRNRKSDDAGIGAASSLSPPKATFRAILEDASTADENQQQARLRPPPIQTDVNDAFDNNDFHQNDDTVGIEHGPSSYPRRSIFRDEDIMFSRSHSPASSVSPIPSLPESQQTKYIPAAELRLRRENQTRQARAPLHHSSPIKADSNLYETGLEGLEEFGSHIQDAENATYQAELGDYLPANGFDSSDTLMDFRQYEHGQNFVNQPESMPPSSDPSQQYPRYLNQQQQQQQQGPNNTTSESLEDFMAQNPIPDGYFTTSAPSPGPTASAYLPDFIEPYMFEEDEDGQSAMHFENDGLYSYLADQSTANIGVQDYSTATYENCSKLNDVSFQTTSGGGTVEVDQNFGATGSMLQFGFNAAGDRLAQTGTGLSSLTHHPQVSYENGTLNESNNLSYFEPLPLLADDDGDNDEESPDADIANEPLPPLPDSQQDEEDMDMNVLDDPTPFLQGRAGLHGLGPSSAKHTPTDSSPVRNLKVRDFWKKHR